MTFVHGRDTYIGLAGKDLSAYTETSELGSEADVHDVTTYGKAAHVYAGGLLDGKVKMSGTYDNTAGAGPRAVIRPLVGSTVELIRRPEGTGVGLPQDRVDVVVKSYTETSPCADYVKWSAELQLSDEIDPTPQT